MLCSKDDFGEFYVSNAHICMKEQNDILCISKSNGYEIWMGYILIFTLENNCTYVYVSAHT